MSRRRHAGCHELDRLARSLPDAREILEDLTRREVKLSIGGSVHDPTDPVGRLLFNVLVGGERLLGPPRNRAAWEPARRHRWGG